MKYIIYNHELDTDSVLDQAQLEAAFPELRAGKLEIIDEIDTDYSDIEIRLSVNNASALNEAISNILQLTVEPYQKPEDLIPELSLNIHNIATLINNGCVKS